MSLKIPALILGSNEILPSFFRQTEDSDPFLEGIPREFRVFQIFFLVTSILKNLLFKVICFLLFIKVEATDLASLYIWRSTSNFDFLYFLEVCHDFLFSP